jgi:hypothetical protein
VVKDPNAPKKNVAAYMFFCKATREEIKKEDDKLSFGEIGKILGARWKEADEKDKAVRASSAPTRCKTSGGCFERSRVATCVCRVSVPPRGEGW